MNTFTKKQTPVIPGNRFPRAAIRWLPAFFLMAIIFGLSSIPSSEMPSFGLWDRLIKKSGHAIGYGLLAMAYWYALQWRNKSWGPALALTLAYAISDEAHQVFVPGRHPSVTDALLVDGSGAYIALLLAREWRKRKAIGD